MPTPETTLITGIIGSEEVIDSHATPTIRYRVTVETDSGQSVLWISKAALKQLAARFATLSGETDSE